MTETDAYNYYKSRECLALSLMYLRKVILNGVLEIEEKDEKHKKCKDLLNKMSECLKILADQIEPIDGSPFLWPDEEPWASPPADAARLQAGFCL